jgi:hypothetical protein
MDETATTKIVFLCTLSIIHLLASSTVPDIILNIVLERSVFSTIVETLLQEYLLVGGASSFFTFTTVFWVDWLGGLGGV